MGGWVALHGHEGLGEPGLSLLTQGESFCLIWKTVDLGSQGKGGPRSLAWARRHCLGQEGFRGERGHGPG